MKNIFTRSFFHPYKKRKRRNIKLFLLRNIKVSLGSICIPISEMAADRFHLSEFSEFLDDTEGHRLAQFLQKKSGALRPGRGRIFDSEPERFSLNVRLKRVSSPLSPPPTLSTSENLDKTEVFEIDNNNKEIKEEIQDFTNEVATEKHFSTSQSIQTVAVHEPEHIEEVLEGSDLPVGEHECSIQTPELPRKHKQASQPVPHISHLPENSHLSERTLVPENERPSSAPENAEYATIPKQTQRSNTTPSPEGPAPQYPNPTLQPSVVAPQMNFTSPKATFVAQPGTPNQVMPPSPRSPLSKQTVSGGVNTADCLRRQVLNRLSTLSTNGRRTLLGEFESTLSQSDFAPPVCSTPRHNIPVGNSERTPPRKSRTPTPARSVDLAGDPVDEISQRSANVYLSQRDQPLIRNMVAALEETIKKLNEIGTSQEQGRAAPEAVTNITALPATQDILQQAQVQTSEIYRINVSHPPGTQELLQDVQKVLQELRTSQVQPPKIVIPVNQTFNNATAQPGKESSNQGLPSGCYGPQQVYEAQTPKIVANTVVHSSPLRCHDTFARSNASKNILVSDSIMEGTHLISCNAKNRNTFVNHPTFTNTHTTPNFPTESNLSSKHNRTSNMSVRKSLTKQNCVHVEEEVEPLHEHSSKDQRSPMRPLNKVTLSDTNCTTTQKNTSVNVRRLSISSLSKNLQFDATPQNVDEANLHQASLNKTSSARNSKRASLTNKNSRRESATAALARQSITGRVTSPLITEDEDDGQFDYMVNKKRSLRKSGPLNLASERPQSDIRSRQTIKRKISNRRTTKLTSPLFTSDTETDSGPPPAHPLNLHHATRDFFSSQKQKKRPLNKPPNTPKNGEKFADELKAHLARLTNHEILDLRKRNSLGQALLAPTRLRKSIAGPKPTLKEQLQIEEQIQLEILRRDLLGEAAGLHEEEEQQEQIQNENVNEIPNASDDLIFSELPPAPEEFEDDTTAKQQSFIQMAQRSKCNSSLLDDCSGEQVSFLPSTSGINHSSKGKKSRKKKPEQMPEITKRYIEIQKKVGKRRFSSQSKRSLYTKGDSASEADFNEKNLPSEKENRPYTPTFIEPIPSPPVVSPLYDLHIPPPPPPLVASQRPPQAQSITPQSTQAPLCPPIMQEYISPPAPFLDNYSERSPSKASNKTQMVQQEAPNDDVVFKKPTVPAPRARRKLKIGSIAKKSKTSDVASSSASGSTDTQSSDEVEGLRRSKRGLVPRKQASLLQSLLEAVQKKSQKEKVKRLEKSRLSERANNLREPIASSTARKATANAKSGRGRIVEMNPERMFSYLGDTNTTSGTITSGSNISRNSNMNQLRTITETSNESDVEVEVMVSAAPNKQSTIESEVPAASNETKAPTKKTSGRRKKDAINVAPSKKHTAPKKNSQARKSAKNANNGKQKPPESETENEPSAKADAASPPIEMPTSSQAAREAERENRSVIFECSRVYLPPPPPLDKLNEMFDQLKNAANKSSDETSSSPTRTATDDTSSATTSANKTRKLRVQVRRLRLCNTSTSTTTSNATSPTPSEQASTSTQTTSERNELLTWLKNVSHLQSESNQDQVYMDMRPSTAGRLYFTDLDGIDYAFYDTEEKSSLGYLRFKPLQCKPLKRTKKYHLHFVVLAGKFQIGTEREHGIFGIGDMVAINIGCRYKITNLDNDVAILMVIKK